ncbi:M12 family metallopeptidase [Flavobacterium anhuiense]|uniref:M12 family metallopeptidase n=1 Tax=Flavobacterium anhuiense TaxID=459526 RepID=UPI000E6CC908|nr:M12 family metallopeptidase [Flavobacterium anhuiense]
MKVEFTKELTGDAFRDLRIAVNERDNNLITENFNAEQIQALEKLKTRPEHIYLFEEYRLLLEMSAQTKKLWKPNQILKIYFFGGQDNRTKRVLDYASIWSKHCSIQFQATNSIEEAQLRIAFQAPSSWSYIGTDALGVPRNEPTINFGWLSDDLPERDYKQVVLHEFGHALGLIHEHQSPAASVKWNKYLVYWHFWENHKWTKADVDRNIFQEFETNSTQHSALDRLSIMGYYIPTQFTLDGQEFPMNYDLSEVDKKYIGELYPNLILS